MKRVQSGPGVTPGRVLRQSAAILFVTLVLGFTVNSMRPSGLTLSTRWSPESQLKASAPNEDLTISMDEAWDLFLNRQALFIDARDEDAYSEGHIEGALSLPWHDFESRFAEIMPQLTPSTRIVTYCDGDACGLSKELALTLLAKGYGNARVLVNGWSKWQEAGFPVSR